MVTPHIFYIMVYVLPPIQTEEEKAEQQQVQLFEAIRPSKKPFSPRRLFVQSPSVYRAAAIDEMMNERYRRLILGIVFLLHVISVIFVIALLLVRWANFSFIAGALPFLFSFPLHYLWAGFLLSGAIFYFFFFLEFFYIASLRPSFVASKDSEPFSLSFDCAPIAREIGFLHHGTFSMLDLHNAFLRSSFVQLVLLRLGIFLGDYRSFLESNNEHYKGMLWDRKEFLDAALREAGEERSVHAGAFITVLYKSDEQFKKFLFDREIHDDDMEGAIGWVERIFDTAIEESRIWDKKRLSRVPGVAKDFGFGYTFVLDTYSHDIEAYTPPLFLESRRKEIDTVEDILSKTGEANVLLVGEEGVGRQTIIEGLAARIANGTVVPVLEYKRMVSFDIDSIVASARAKGEFEYTVIKALNEAIRAGNIILVLKDLPHMIESAAALGSDIIALAEPYIAGSRLQVIATSDPYNYHKTLEKSGRITALFSVINVEEPDVRRVIVILEEVSALLEWKSKVIFTFQALKRVAEIADRYIQTGAMPEKAINLADEVATTAALKGEKIVYPAQVNEYATKKLKVPLQGVEEKEKRTLLDLEALLHERIIDQEVAIKTISNAMRRARLELQDKERPLGSFLFLGPTGVGKTETAKALASVYFGGVEAMIRFDMSEYQGMEGMRKLIGSFDSPEPGILATRIRENPFALLLFDEIEKSSEEVLNLFLQILEEGFFADGKGKRVSMRETIMIATSNAGSNLIWEMVEKNKDPSSIEKEVIDYIRKEGMLKPELLNRFDGIVIYRPLAPEHLLQVARLLLKELQERMRAKDITFQITDALVAKIAEIGYNPVFGARPMRRAIADRVEAIIAKKMLEGELKRGSVFQLDQEAIDHL